MGGTERERGEGGAGRKGGDRQGWRQTRRVEAVDQSTAEPPKQRKWRSPTPCSSAEERGMPSPISKKRTWQVREGARTDPSDRYRTALHPDRDRERDMRWREERRGMRGGRGRGRGRGRREWMQGSWRDDNQRDPLPPEGAQGEEEENGFNNSRLYSALIDPQQVPRKGFFYEASTTSTSVWDQSFCPL